MYELLEHKMIPNVTNDDDSMRQTKYYIRKLS